jgi:hypothetical protein
MATMVDIELVPEESESGKRYEFLEEGDQQLRAFIFETMANADIDGNIMITNMEATFQWIKSGPAQQQQQKRSPVRKVADRGTE